MLHKVTLTGADTETEINALRDLSAQYSFLEWGILFSYSRMGTERYPSLSWITNLIKYKTEMNLSLHLCGDAVHQFLNRDPIMYALATQFDRVQLNFNNVRTPVDPKEILGRLEQWRVEGRAIITQHNDNNADLWKEIKVRNHHILFDASGGEGKLLVVQPPLEDKYCGYAGGIGVQNVLEIIDQIDKVNHHLYSIDMESSLRTDGEFDLNLAERVLLRAHNHLTTG